MISLCNSVLCAHVQAGETALHVAARYGHPEVLAHLCTAGGNPNVQDNVSQ